MKTHQRFTLIELVVSISIIMILAALLVPAVLKGRERSRQVTCINNVRNLAMAIQLFYNEHEEYPQNDSLEQDLEDVYHPDHKAFECPSTHLSYDMFYVPRGSEETENYFIGCPYHRVVNFGPGRGTATVEVAEMDFDGDPASPGQELGSGTLTLADGSTVQITGRAMVLASFRRRAGGRLYSFLRIFEDYGSTAVHSTVPNAAGSRFEIVTPAAIAGVAGTEFTVQTSVNSATDEVETDVTVISGKVIVKGPYVDTPVPVTAGSPAGRGRKKAKRHKIHKRRRRGGNGGGGDDDDDDDDD